eukprot:3058581-Alexandrium_andersonii.AAC.1
MLLHSWSGPRCPGTARVADGGMADRSFAASRPVLVGRFGVGAESGAERTPSSLSNLRLAQS